MKDYYADVAVLGAGFGGCLTALILNRIGLKTIVVERGAHPRFAIGESSTPIADFVLRDLCRKYDLPRLEPLTSYGAWQEHYPEIVCGIKRGFSYFRHEQGKLFEPREDHANELLVAASNSDALSDTHWLRSDVDAFFADEVKHAGIELLENTEIAELASESNNGWKLRGKQFDEDVSIRCRFLIDATGNGNALARALQIPVRREGFQTHSRAIYGHFTGVTPWHDYMRERGGHLEEHPYYCDHAAVHHLFDEGWMWQLRFNNGVTSAGFVLDAAKRPLDMSLSPEEEWKSLLEQSPALSEQFEDALLVAPEGGLQRTGRLQRQVSQAAGANWAMLPNTVGFIDPLHSTGIAHTLCGIERLAEILERSWNTDELKSELKQYEETVFRELDLIDRLVGGCYETLDDFRKFTAYSMLYFAAATTFENQRASSGRYHRPYGGAFLRANDEVYCGVVRSVWEQLRQETTVSEFEEFVAEAIEPFNIAGLCDPSVQNMYRYTAARKDK